MGVAYRKNGLLIHGSSHGDEHLCSQKTLLATCHGTVFQAFGVRNPRARASDRRRLARETEGYSCSDLAALTREAAKAPFQNFTEEQLMSSTPDQVRGVDEDGFQEQVWK